MSNSMLRSSFLSLFLALVFSLPCAAQDAEVLRWMELLTQEKTEQRSKSGEGKEAQRLQQKFLLVQELIGGGHLLDKDVVEEKLFKVAQRLQPEMLPKDKKTQRKAKRARKNLADLIGFVRGLRPAVHEALLTQYAQKKSRVMRKALKGAVMEFPGEGLRFASAIVINRVINCFGANVAKQFEWKTSYKDPSCIHEVWETLKDPVFYAGFMAFVLASRVTQAKLTTLLKLDQALGAKGLYSLSTSLKAQLVSNAALTAGFFADHVTQTILKNEDLHKCAKDGNVKLSLEGSDPEFKKRGGRYMGKNEKGDEIYALEVLIKNPHCRKFYKHLASKEFLAEHTFLVPLPSLLITAAALGVTTTATVSALQKGKKPIQGVQKTKAYRLAKLNKAKATKLLGNKKSQLAQFLKENTAKKTKLLKLYKAGKAIKNFTVGLIFVPGIGLIPGFALGTTRLVAFFQINEIVEPIIRNGYYNFTLKLWNNSRHDQIRSSQEDYLKRWYQESPLQALKKEGSSLLSKEKSKPQGPSPLLLEEKKCSNHYSEKANDSFHTCSKIPLFADMSTFRDYSKSWRQKKILGRFLELHARWKAKMDNSVYHYKTTLYQMRIMSISREMKYSSNGQVDYYDRFFNQFENSIAQAVKEASTGYDPNYDVLKEITSIYEKHSQLGEEQFEKRWDYISNLSFVDQLFYRDKVTPAELPFIKKRAKILKSLGKKEKRLFDLLQAKGFLQLEFDELTNGDIYKDVANDEDEVDELKSMALKFLEAPIEFITSKQAMLNKSWKTYDLLGDLNLLETNEINGRQKKVVSLKKIVTEMIKSEDEDISGQGLYLLRNLLDNDFHPLAGSLKVGTATNSSPKLTPEQADLRDQLAEKLQFMDPTYKHEYLYALLLGKKLREESSGNVNWKSNKDDFSTKHIADYTMSQLFCEQASTLADWFGSEGTPHIFQHPLLGGKTNFCKNYIALVEKTPDEKYQSVNKSVFVSEQGVYQGLFQVYLNLPEGRGIWNTERQTKQWWINTFEPKAMTQMIDFEENYKRLVKENFLPKIGNLYQAREILEVNRGNLILKLLHKRSFFGFGTKSLEYSAGKDLAQSLSAELKEYRSIIYNVGRPLAPNRHWLMDKGNQFSECFVQLLGSLQSKNYKSLKKQCENSLDELKNKLVYSKGYTQGSMLTLAGKKEEQLSKEEIVKLILWRAFKMIDKIVFEVEGYKQIVTGELNLNLKKMTNKDCFEHNLVNDQFKDMLMEREDESTDSCFKPASNN